MNPDDAFASILASLNEAIHDDARWPTAAAAHALGIFDKGLDNSKCGVPH